VDFLEPSAEDEAVEEHRARVSLRRPGKLHEKSEWKKKKINTIQDL
jgi:hypothetical protein